MSDWWETGEIKTEPFSVERFREAFIAMRDATPEPPSFLVSTQMYEDMVVVSKRDKISLYEAWMDIALGKRKP